MKEITMRTASFGAGIQSTALLLMAEEGKILDGLKPDVAIFADTKWEPERVYKTISAVRERVSFPIEIVDNGRNLAEDVSDGINASGKKWVPIPVFIRAADGKKSGFRH